VVNIHDKKIGGRSTLKGGKVITHRGIMGNNRDQATEGSTIIKGL